MFDASIGRTWFVVALALALTTGTAPSFAVEEEEEQQEQTQSQDEEKADADDQEKPAEGEYLEEIYVTAQKRVQSVIEVPVSMTTIDQEDLEVFTSGGADIKTLSGRVPSLVIESSFGKAFPRFYIRGLGNTDFDLNASQPVSMVYDEVVLENPILK
ncbi:MAG TPA: Plug domain-containing protein, partial [Thermoanaerobaculia bacterium]|nr:Plug domain-containing protein [Thermoanaerobaculia bacterium]